MSSREHEFLELYREARLVDQLSFYEARKNEFEAAQGQIVAVSAIVFGLASTVGVLAGLDIGGKLVFAVLATILPAVSTALSAYEGVFGFERHAKIYDDAARSLKRIEEPDLQKEPDGAAALASYIEQVENVFRREQAQWGQLQSEAQPSTDPGRDS
jgi:SMODS and SLOG-associating 2TM effector domain 1